MATQNNKKEGFGESVINCLSCIYGDYHLNPYKMGVFKNWHLASFNKKRRKKLKKRFKITHFWEELRVLAL